MNKWYKVALLNLVVLAFLGLVLRYKINFPLEFVEQKKLLHAHSHFAFSGWVSFLLQLLVLHNFTNLYHKQQKFWNGFFWFSLAVNYGMIISFALQGYAFFSITLSTLSLILSYVFTYKVWNQVKASAHAISARFILAALFFLVFSSLGPYALSYIMVTKNANQYFYHNALYFFLHFQYNGWFTFAVLGFLIRKIETAPIFIRRYANLFFLLLVITCIPSYLLSTLWKKMPAAVIANNALTAVVQLVALYYLIRMLLHHYKTIYSNLPLLVKWLYSTAVAAFIVKILLQCFSAHPQLSHIAFAYRPIIIGYLHLVFLVFVSLYLLGLLVENNTLRLTHFVARAGLIIFAASVVINEVLLGIQGFISIYYIYFPAVNMLLFINTVIIFLGALLVYIAANKKDHRLQTQPTNNE